MFRSPLGANKSIQEPTKMIQRPLRPNFSFGDQKKLIAALGEARDWAIKCASGYEYSSPKRPKCEVLVHAVDDLVEELTGDRTLFHLKPHST